MTVSIFIISPIAYFVIARTPPLVRGGGRSNLWLAGNNKKIKNIILPQQILIIDI